MPSKKNPKVPRVKATPRYEAIILEVFERHHTPGVNQFEFTKREFEEIARELGIVLPDNTPDIIYSYRYRNELPVKIKGLAKKGNEWLIRGAGKGRYRFEQAPASRILPQADLLTVKIPDSTPEIINRYKLDDEQALLAKVRYNRLIDIFLGITAYSLQNHLRTTIKNVSQVEIDEIYVGVDRSGRQFVIPVQAKGGKDKLGVVQTEQDIMWCAQRFPELICRSVSVQFLANERIAMFELVIHEGQLKVVNEKHYELVAADEITLQDLKNYSLAPV